MTLTMHATPTSPGPAGPLTTGFLAGKLNARLIGPPDLPITHINTLERGAPGAITFIRDKRYAAGWPASKASATLVTRGIEVPGHDPSARALLIVENADLALNTVLELMAPPAPARRPGAHPSAIVDPSASIAPTAHIGPGCIIEAGAVVGEGTALIAQVYLGHQARIGRGCTLHPGVRILDRCVVGDACLLHAGVVIGADGFGFRPDPPRGIAKIPHIGNVEIQPGVEIGANSCVDRAKFGSTVIGAGTKIDNLVQIAHGVQLGRCCIICAQAGIAGSAVIGDGVMLGGQAGVSDNLTVGAGAQLAGKAGAMQDVPAGEMWFGHPAYNGRQAFRDLTLLRRLAAEYRDQGRPARKRGDSSPD
ncbi:MAG: UDP-3-O-(3-hydroxymyristoyl)glucosamine N-acyltransferase [Phycisphaerales bacterium]|nr:UDP-3-O-(3-hydroxymyristoyl)glucosamine N-acyltransferase [Phycisphaerales bacterium]